ncbi:MAG: NAD+ synthase, partial [Actinobacteria bacterium]|nr:NAD+ synthase [Actinomycetota bacterium]
MLKLYLAQINPVVGDIRQNHDLIMSHIVKAAAGGADIVVFPELALTGYPPEDLLLKTAFINENLKYIDKIAKEVGDIIAIVGFAGSSQGSIYNSAAIICREKIVSVYNKQHLPNYSVFDEERYFQKGDINYIYKIRDHLVGVNICEDIFYAAGPARIQSIAGGAELIINISASPYHTEKIVSREKMLSTRALDNIVNIAYVNLVGGQDELVFDGNSLLIDEKGGVIRRCRPFTEDYLIAEIDPGTSSAARIKDTKFKNQKMKLVDMADSYKVIALDLKKRKGSRKKTPGSSPLRSDDALLYNEFISCPEEEVLEALVLGTRDYIRKNGFTKVVIALSGGIDSAITTVIASLAVGKENVTAVLMPSGFSSRESIDDSVALANNLDIKYMTIPISGIYETYLKDLKSIFRGDEINTTKENIQARIRGGIIMAFSNENGWLALSTGNKSEISVGYCTLYGDMAGGFSPIKDVYKTMVYSICRFINKKYGGLIPENILTRAPSAELKPDQKDQDRLPPYDMLDHILKAYIEDDLGYRAIVEIGFDPAIVKDVLNMVDNNEYKRRQGSPGIKITARAFGKDRRYPITN